MKPFCDCWEPMCALTMALEGCNGSGDDDDDGYTGADIVL